MTTNDNLQAFSATQPNQTMVAFMLRSVVLTSQSYLLNILNSMNLQTILNIRAAALWLTEAAQATVD